jgi:hypothetical protein
MKTALLIISIVAAALIAHSSTAGAGTPRYLVVAKPQTLPARQRELNRIAAAGYTLVGVDRRSYVLVGP